MITTDATQRVHRAEHHYAIITDNQHSATTALFTQSKQCTMNAHMEACAIVDSYDAVYYVSRQQAAKILRSWRRTTTIREHTTLRRYVLDNSSGKADSPYCSQYCTNKRPK